MNRLSPLALEAVEEFERLCISVQSVALSRKQFSDFLQACGLLCSKCDRDLDANGLFDQLISMCRVAEEFAIKANSGKLCKSKALQDGHLDGKALRCLYAYHPSYNTCRNPMDTSLALTDYVKEIFESSIAEDDCKALSLSSDSNHMVRSSSKVMLRRLDDSSSQHEKVTIGENLNSGLTVNTDSCSDFELESAVHELMTSHHSQNYLFGYISENEVSEDETLDIEMISSSLLQYPYPTSVEPGDISPASLFRGKLPAKFFNPLHIASSNFVDVLDEVVLNHDALEHHVLSSFAMGSWGGLKGTAHHLANFMYAYRHFTATFCTHLTETINLLSEEDSTSDYVDILQDNMEEEKGVYDDETISMISSLGLDVDQVCNVSHKDLYIQCYESLRQITCISEDMKTKYVCLDMKQCLHIAEPLVIAFENACNPARGATATTAISAMYYGSELITNQIYSKLSAYLLTMIKKSKNCPLNKHHLAFFLLHIDMDVEHADNMRKIVTSLASDERSRLKIAYTAHTILKARMELFDRFVEASFPPTGHGGEDSAKLYNKQSQNWVRKGATCLSDFTGRPIIFDICEDFVRGAHVLDVGCGEGYGARKLVEMGARRVVGLDISEEMIERANANPMKSIQETYTTCDADKILEKLNGAPASFGLVPGRLVSEGCFDLAIAIFLFNYTSISKMNAICDQVYKTLKPGGHFIFSVPHPFMLNVPDNEKSGDGCFSFVKGDVQSHAYFSLRDRKFAGVIRALGGRDLNVKMLFKTISDYTETISKVGFDILKVHECRVLPEHVVCHPHFFESVKDIPLHIVFNVMKPRNSTEMGRIPKAITWYPFEKSNAHRRLSVIMPDVVSEELIDFIRLAYARGVTEETYVPTSNDFNCLKNVASFASGIRSRILEQTGAVHVIGLDLTKLSINMDDDGNTERAKFAFFILSSFIGRVDGNARGLLFDVKDNGLNTNGDNVLFSVSRESAPYHTDGASADRAYDAVGLLCINPASEGGVLHISIASNALQLLKQNLPKFILNELFRRLPRDILENGRGEGVNRAALLRFSRTSDLLKLRVRHNAFPIFEEGHNGRNECLRMRYMRQWIESGHVKGQLDLPPFLKLALDALDSALDIEKVASIKMKAGEIIYCNNMSVCHGRDAFTNRAGDPKRHKVRAWLQLQEYQSE